MESLKASLASGTEDLKGSILQQSNSSKDELKALMGAELTELRRLLDVEGNLRIDAHNEVLKQLHETDNLAAERLAALNQTMEADRASWREALDTEVLNRSQAEQNWTENWKTSQQQLQAEVRTALHPAEEATSSLAMRIEAAEQTLATEIREAQHAWSVAEP